MCEASNISIKCATIVGENDDGAQDAPCDDVNQSDVLFLITCSVGGFIVGARRISSLNAGASTGCLQYRISRRDEQLKTSRNS